MKLHTLALRTAFLCGSLLVTPAYPSAQQPEKPDLQGSYVLETVAPCTTIREKIEATVKGMPLRQDEARIRLIDGNLPAPRLIKISYTSREVTISSLPSGPMTTPLDGRFVKARRDAEDIEIGTRWRKGKLERTFRNDVGQRVNSYSLRADGKLVMQVTAEARSLVARRFFTHALKYELVYSRTAADDQDIAYQKYPDCQEDSKRKGRIVITSAAEQAKKMLTDELHDLRASRMAHARKGYEPLEIINAVQKAKESLIADLVGREGLGVFAAYMRRKIILPTVSQLADPNSGLASKETLERVKNETSASFDLAIDNSPPFDVYVYSEPPGATFELKAWPNDRWFTATDGRVPTLYEGEYNYKVTKIGFKEISFPIQLNKTIKRLDCKFIKDDDPDSAHPCTFPSPEVP